jgi:hypothetical protein
VLEDCTFCAWVPKTLEGALDCIVVKVVVSERSEWFGEENVLPPPTVLLFPVSALDLPECTVSGCVATVGAVDLLLLASGWRRPDPGSSADVKLSFADRGVTGLPKER